MLIILLWHSSDFNWTYYVTLMSNEILRSLDCNWFFWTESIMLVWYRIYCYMNRIAIFLNWIFYVKLAPNIFLHSSDCNWSFELKVLCRLVSNILLYSSNCSSFLNRNYCVRLLFNIRTVTLFGLQFVLWTGITVLD